MAGIQFSNALLVPAMAHNLLAVRKQALDGSSKWSSPTTHVIWSKMGKPSSQAMSRMASMSWRTVRYKDPPHLLRQPPLTQTFFPGTVDLAI